MLSYFPDRDIAHRDPRKEQMSVRQLTQNTSGLACIGYPEEVTLAEMEASPDYVQFALDLPMAAEPGTKFSYCSPGMHLLSAVLTQATGQNLFDYAREKLFGPLGITSARWDADPQGITRGWGDLHLLPSDMAKLGQLWLEAGLWNGKRIIPADWLEAATAEPIRSDRYEDYGYGFWIGPKSEPIPYFMASGRGGQRITVVPSLGGVFVTTGGGFDPGDVMLAVAGALIDPENTLAPNLTGEAELDAALAAVSAPPAPHPVLPLPEIAAEISGKTYSLEPNVLGLRSVFFEFPGGPEASFTLTNAEGAVPRPVGLDGVYRWSAGANELPIGISGDWADERTLVLDYDTVADIRAYTITALFAGNMLDLTIAQRDEHEVIRLGGEAEPE